VSDETEHGSRSRQTFPTTHVEAGECILESLFKSEEFKDGKVHGRVQTETTFVWTECGVELWEKR
jgi:hypothetical protein